MARFAPQSVVFVCDSIKSGRSGISTVEFVPAKDSPINWGSGQNLGVIVATGPTDQLASYAVGSLYQFDISQVG